jgi:type I restriction-modification system DNA methylase subunit
MRLLLLSIEQREGASGPPADREDEEDRAALPRSLSARAQARGRAAVIVPDGVLFGSSNAHKTLRRLLVEEQKLDAVSSMPGGVFKPYAGVSTAILLFTKINSGGTDHVWFYDVDADGMSLDDKRTELLPPERLGEVAQRAPGEILKALGQLEAEIQQGMKELEGVLK